MFKSINALLFLVTTLVLVACAGTPAAPAATSEPTQAADLTPTIDMSPTPALPALVGKLHWFGISSFRLDGPPTIYLDPVNLGENPLPADIILVSHGHADHWTTLDIEKIAGPETVIIVSPNADRAMTQLPFERTVLNIGEKITVKDVEIEAVPAYDDDRHRKIDEDAGFILTIGGERLYFSGPTAPIPEMADIRCDVAILNAYMPDRVVEEANMIKPVVVIPVHFITNEPALIETTARYIADRFDGIVIVPVWEE